MPTSALTATEIAAITEGRLYGLDIEAERCDTEYVTATVKRLRLMDGTTRDAVVAHLNDGYDMNDALDALGL